MRYEDGSPYAYTPGIGVPQGILVVVEVDGTEVTLGGAEIRLLARDGRWLIAPNLVLHYVAAPGYLPPR
ncbi:hypothetical protein JBE27_08430, partial [Streptomyces albiflaviniger]|nr:hypothetical protein [Streptomyces albiflaviniger]